MPVTALIHISGPAEILFFAVYAAWLLGESIGATIVPRLRYGARKGERRDRGSFYINVVTLVLAIYVDFVLSGRRISLLPVWAYYLGITFMLVGLALRQWAVAVLGRFFTLTVKVQSDHAIVETGPYKLMRHPSYTGLLLTLIGIALALQTWIGLLINVLVFAAVFGYRIYVEERALISALGEKYISYSKRTKRLIPYIF